MPSHRQKFRLLLIAAAAMLGWPSVAYSGQISAANPQSVYAAITKAGDVAEFSTAPEQDPGILVKTSSGFVFIVYFHGCQNHVNCKYINMTSTFGTTNSAPVDWINTKNSVMEHARIFSPKEKNITIAMTINLMGDGMSEELFLQYYRLWGGKLIGFRSDIASAPW